MLRSADTVFSVFGRYHALARMLEQVLYSAVFVEGDAVRERLATGPACTAKFFFEQGTHFTTVRALEAQKADLMDDL